MHKSFVSTSLNITHRGCTFRALSIWTKKPVCGSGMSSGKMERYSVTDLVNNERLVGRFPFDRNSGNENQMEHVNFWNDVSLISKSLTLPLKSLLWAFGEINPDSRHWNGREHAILVLVAVFAQKTFGKQQRWLGNVLMDVKISKLPEFPICGQPRKISGISVKWKAPNKPLIIYKVCHAVAFHFATGHSGTANWVFCSNGKRPSREIVRNFRNCIPEINVFHLIFKQDFRQMESARVSAIPIHESRNSIAHPNDAFWVWLSPNSKKNM